MEALLLGSVGLLILVNIIVVVAVARINKNQKEQLSLMANQNGFLSDQIKTYQSQNEIKYLHLTSLFAAKADGLNPASNEWILKSGDTIKSFEPGKILSVVNNKDKSEVKYEYINDSIICTNLEDGVISATIKYSLSGVPQEGKSYNKDGIVENEFTYNELGQVKESVRS